MTTKDCIAFISAVVLTAAAAAAAATAVLKCSNCSMWSLVPLLLLIFALLSFFGKPRVVHGVGRSVRLTVSQLSQRC